MRAARNNVTEFFKLLTVCAVLCLTVGLLGFNVMAQSGTGPCPSCKVVHSTAVVKVNVNDNSVNVIDSVISPVVAFAKRINRLVVDSVRYVFDSARTLQITAWLLASY